MDKREIQNKVVTKYYVKREELNPFQGDLKLPNEEEIEKLQNRILRKWFRAPIFVWYQNNNYILDWHQRLKALNNLASKGHYLKDDLVPIVYIEWETEKEAREIILEQHSKYSEFNEEVLIEFQEWLDIEDLPVLELEELNLKIEDLNIEITEDEENIENLSNKVPVIKKWDLFKLWEHYLLCWDATDKNDIKRLMQWNKAQMIFTDPPYNVKVSNIGSLWKTKHSEFVMASWEMTEEEFTDFLNKVFENFIEYSTNWSIHYICMDWKHIFEITSAIRKNYTELKNLCIWNKDNGWMWTFYRSKHELIFVCKNGEAKHTNNFELWQNWRYRTNVWDYKWVNSFWSNREELKLHPTVKPIKLVADAILDCSNSWENILDLFGWSWTTLIAAEKTNRKCFMMELDEKYIEVIIRRYYSLFKENIVCLNRKLDINKILDN